ncbi:acyl-CoA N-acyltransferase [Phlegmacium glaucopus]|nr:acyl-CoA N-acyltransferase [Phlegmacium glaucopus]
MSAYGDIKRIISPVRLPSTIWNSRVSDILEYITIHHLTLTTARALPGFLEYLGTIFAKEIADGMTYPQEGDMNQETFEAYFFSADVFVGILGPSPRTAISGSEQQDFDIEEERASRTWDDCVAGYYYIKPNYPGRSSHICNAGFVVPPLHRGKGYGKLLAQSYVHYAPRLGYQASVFNLVYVNNAASVKLWENLGFTKAGRIPRAGRLRTKDGKGEEYIDAWVFYKSFLET